MQKVRRGVADVAASRKRVELQIQQLEQQSATFESQDRKAWTRRSGVQQQVDDLRTRHQQLQDEEQKLTTAAQRLQAKLDGAG